MTSTLDERRLLRALRAGDPDAYARLHDLYDARLVALAMAHGCSRAVAEEVVQETWTAVVRSLPGFRGRSSLKTWIFRILVNAANAQARRERRSVPVPSETVVDLGAFRGRSAARPPDEQLLLKEAAEHVHAAIEALAPSQRQVITLRDVHGWSSEEVRGHLGLSAANERVLLHRARVQVRRSLSGYLGPAPARAAA